MSTTEHYLKTSYDHLPRWSSYWYQINNVLKMKPSFVLEIGAGNKTVAEYIRSKNVTVTTLDVDANLKPDIVASAEKLPVEDNSIDVVLAAQVLEHLPFEKFPVALKEIFRVSRKGAVVSLPRWGRAFQIEIKIPILPRLKHVWKAPGFKKNKFEESNGHFWEIGKRSFGIGKIRSEMEAAGFDIEKDFCVFEHPYHQFFILKKK